MKSLKSLVKGALLLGLLGLSASPHAAGADGGGTSQVIPVQKTTVPANGDVNPYGVAFVPAGFPQGKNITIHPGDILVSNFNSAAGGQGTGTTIVSITPSGDQSPANTFFQGTPPLGLTTALVALRSGFVLVGNAPLQPAVGMMVPATVQQGSILVLNARAEVVTTFTDPVLLDGPWDLTADDRDPDHPVVFVSSVLNGVVSRLDLKCHGHVLAIDHRTQVASGYGHHTDPAALVVGPTGLAYDSQRDILYVASTADNAIFAVGNAEHVSNRSGRGTSIFTNAELRGPLGLAFAPNGNLVTSNGDAVNASTNPDPNRDNSNILEFTVGGKLVGRFSIDPVLGSAFGIAFGPETDEAVRFAAVDDTMNVVTVYDLHVP